MTDLLYSLSFALDSVERDLLGVTTHHASRVAFISAEMASAFGIDGQRQVDLACAALLHDNALTEYAKVEYNEGADLFDRDGELGLPRLGVHCAMGERNVSSLPFYPRVKGAVLNHHENADGSGPFGLKADETPLYAQIIHAADVLDLRFAFGTPGDSKHEQAIGFLEENRGHMFSPEIVDTFIGGVSEEAFRLMTNDHPDDLLNFNLPNVEREYSSSDLSGIATIFARITDYKSEFTRDHSIGVAEKARDMALSYGWGEEMAAKVYLAGSLHDIGKLCIDNDVLEKPAKLTEEEYVYMQTHAWYTYEILRKVRGLEDVTHWAAMHHEKLDGSGYPFGKHGYELSDVDRLLACVDIYQALTENRPYRSGMEHAKAISVMGTMVDAGKIDGRITDDIDKAFES